MIWTRKSLTETSGWFNQRPLAPLDETLRLPLALEEIFKLLREDYGIALKKPLVVHKGYFYFRSYRDYFFQIIFQPKAYLVLGRVLRESRKAKKEWERLVQEFLKEIGRLKGQDLSKLGNKALLEEIEKTIRLDAYWIFKLGFGLPIIYHQFSEILLKFLYRLLVRDKHSQNYHELIIGYPSKLKEADLAFWEVVKGKLDLESYVNQYGLRATDATLVIPTIGEDRERLQRQIASFQKASLPDFEEIKKRVLEKRKLREKYVADNFRSWVPFGRVIFNKALEIARDYISVRETRRFYYTMESFYIRKGLLELGKKLKVLKDFEEIFFLTREDLEKAVLKPEGVDENRLRGQIIKKKKQWEERSKQIPPEEVEL